MPLGCCVALELVARFALARFQEPGTVDWQLIQTWVEPILVVKLYVLLALFSIAIAAVYIVRSWVLFPRSRGAQTELSRRTKKAVFHRQAVSLRRWMILNILAWGAVTVAGLIELVRGTWVSRTAAIQLVAGGLAEVLWPSELFFFTLIILYVARWHILWRAERPEQLELRNA
jgi:hypothetical protein